MFRFSVLTVSLAVGLCVTQGCNSRSTSTTQSRNEAPNSQTPPKTTGTAFVRYVTNLDAHSNSDLYFGEIRLFSTPDAKTPTEYKEVPAERRDFVLRAAGSPENIAIETNSEGLKDGKYYSVIAYEDTKGKPVLKVFNDNESAPSAGKAKIRIIHAAPGMDPVNVYASGRKDKLAGESRFSSASSWQEVDPVSGPLEVRAGDGKTGQVAEVPDARIEAGKLYTLIVEGGRKSREKLRVLTVENNPSAS